MNFIEEQFTAKTGISPMGIALRALKRETLSSKICEKSYMLLQKLV